VGVVAEVVEDLGRAGEGALGVHDPVVVPELREQSRERAALGEGVGEAEPAGGLGHVKGVEVLGAEDLGERAHGEEKAGLGGDPAVCRRGRTRPR